MPLRGKQAQNCRVCAVNARQETLTSWPTQGNSSTKLIQISRIPCLQETFGAMAKTEKIFYILEQVRLCLDRKDYIR